MVGIGVGLSPSNIKFFSPLSVPETVAWFSAQYGVTNVSGAASAWTDQAASHFASSQATAGNRPTITTAFNSTPTLTFTGASSQDLTNTVSNMVTAGATRYVLAVIKSADTTGGSIFTFRLDTTGGRVWNLLAWSSGSFFYFTDGISNSVIDGVAAPTITSPFLIEWELTLGAQPIVRINNLPRVLSSTLSATAEAGTTGFRIGSGPAAARPWNGPMSDIYIASGIPSLENKTKLRNYFSHHAGITLPPDGIINLWDPNIAASVTPTTGGLADGSPVLSIADQAGGITLSRFTTGYEPTYKTNILNGQACLRYAGSTQWMRTATDATAAIGTWSVICVVQGNSNGGALFNVANDGNGYSGFVTGINSTPSWRVSGAGGTSDHTATTRPFPDNNPHTFFHVFDGTHAGNLVYQDNVLVPNSNGASTADPGTTALARRFSLGNISGTQQFTGDFFYVAIVDHPLTAAERTQWQNYLKTRFPGLT